MLCFGDAGNFRDNIFFQRDEMFSLLDLDLKFGFRHLFPLVAHVVRLKEIY